MAELESEFELLLQLLELEQELSWGWRLKWQRMQHVLLLRFSCLDPPKKGVTPAKLGFIDLTVECTRGTTPLGPARAPFTNGGSYVLKISTTLWLGISFVTEAPFPTPPLGG